jgi:crotonobetainyl-CoA:carnitine CoA-transferase CaiB-like acyl-CoA transferase
VAERGILTGLRILDLSDGMAGPLAAMMLAEAGADVVKIEPPCGDVARGSPGFATWNRSKRGVVLDLAAAHDREQLAAVIPAVDVMIHGFAHADERAYDITPERLRTINPRLIVCRVRGYPNGHPDDSRPGWEPLVLARLGLFDEQRGRRPGPVYLSFPLGSSTAALLAASGVMARLVHRLWTGWGGLVATSLVQGALLPMTMHWFRAEHPTDGLARAMPKDRAVTLFECADGVWIHVMKAPDDTPWMRDAFAAMGPDAVAAANRAVSAHPLCPNQGANAVAFRQRASADWLTHLHAHDIPAEAARELGYAFRDEQARANHYVIPVDDPVLGTMRQAGCPFHVEPPARVERPAPALGEHTREVLAELAAAARALGPPPTPATPPQPTPPLAGLRVVDFGSYLAGPLGPMLLADLGADVVKVEARGGDSMRWNEAAFEGCQRGKRSVLLDLRDPEERPRLAALVRSADVVHHNIRLDAAARLGIDGPALRAMNQRVIFCHVSSYGPDGPRAGWPGYDQLFQALTGWELETAGAGNPPSWLRFGMMDHLAASASVVATLLALYHREQTGAVQDVSASLLGAALLSTSHTYLRSDNTVEPVARLDRAQTGLGWACRIYQTADGWIAVFSPGADGPTRLCAALAVDDPAEVERVCAERGSEAVLLTLAEAGIDAEHVRLDQRDGFLDSADNRACGLVVAYDHATYGRMEQIGAFWDFDDLPLQLDRAAPALGQHSDEILASLELSYQPGVAHGRQ